MTTHLALAAVSYDMNGAAAASGVSKATLTKAIAADELVVHYVGSKRVVRAADLDDWIRSLPTERPGR
jgi:hypothetical protein